MEQCAITITSVPLDKFYSTASWSFVLIFVPLVAIFGILCNCAFVFVVVRLPFMRNITNIFLVNLAIADSSLLIAAFSQYMGDYLVCPLYDLRFSFHTAFGCSFPNFLIYLCYYASLWTVTLVSIERYLAICHTFWHRRVSSNSRAIRMVISVWIISLLFACLSTPYTPIYVCLINTNDSRVKEIIPYCKFNCAWCGTALYFTDVLQFLIALVITLTMYTLILRGLNKSTLSVSSTMQGQIRAHQTHNTVAKMLIVNGALFFVCLFPFSIANIDSISNHFGVFPFNATLMTPIGWAGRVLFLVNSAMNPMIYNATNPRYRSAFKEAFGLTEKKYSRMLIHTTSLASQMSRSTRI